MKRGAQFNAATLLLTCGAALLLSPAAGADELKLKDGSKISGTIVGFEENSFKVKTNYGYAVVLKDQVTTISMSDAPATASSEKKPEPAAEKNPAPAQPKPAKPETAVAPASVPAAGKSAAPVSTGAKSSTPAAAPAPAVTPTPTSVPTKAPASAGPTTTATTTASAPPTTPNGSASSPQPTVAKNAPNIAATKPSAATTTNAPAPAAAPAKAAGPPPVREEVSGNSYVNDTYGFRMYKPPGWDLIAGARAIMPGALAALGTSDERTYLMIGLAPAGETLTDGIDQAEQRLREAMASFRVTDQKRMMVSGVSSIAHRFRGSVDSHEWSGVVVFVPLGAHIYTIFGMTYAESDLVQIQENVINRAITSLQFTKN